MVDGLRVRTEKHPERTDLGHRHAHEIPIEVFHEVQVMNVETDMTEAFDFRWHMYLLFNIL